MLSFQSVHSGSLKKPARSVFTATEKNDQTTHIHATVAYDTLMRLCTHVRIKSMRRQCQISHAIIGPQIYIFLHIKHFLIMAYYITQRNLGSPPQNLTEQRSILFRRSNTIFFHPQFVS